MTPLLFADITVFVLSLLVGFEVISKVPATLHTPLMSGVQRDPRRRRGRRDGAGRQRRTRRSATCCCSSRPSFAAMNVVGGYVVTDRMLEMFRPGGRNGLRSDPAGTPGASGPMSGFDTLTHLLYLARRGLASSLGLHLMNSPGYGPARQPAVRRPAWRSRSLTTVALLAHDHVITA